MLRLSIGRFQVRSHRKFSINMRSAFSLVSSRIHDRPAIGRHGQTHWRAHVIPSSVPRRLSRPVFRSKAWTDGVGLGSHGT